MNLVKNSSDAVGGEGWVMVSTLQLGAGEPLPCGCQRTPGLGPTCSIIKVEDDGTGLDPQVRAHAFEPFFSTKEVGEGSGLGLSSVYAIVGRLGGHVCLKDRRPRGAVCHVVLPATEPSEEFPDAAERVGARLAGRVLVADDEDMIRNVLASRLRRAGLDVLVAADGVDALHQLDASEEPVDLILSDLVMPKMDGWALVQAARALFPDVKVLLMSGFGDEVLDGYGVDRDGIELLSKPFRLDEVVQRIDDLLREQRAERARSAV